MTAIIATVHLVLVIRVKFNLKKIFNHKTNINFYNNINKASTSSLVLHSNSFEKPIMNKENFVDSENIVAILTHTGSATSSDNE